MIVKIVIQIVAGLHHINDILLSAFSQQGLINFQAAALAARNADIRDKALLVLTLAPASSVVAYKGVDPNSVILANTGTYRFNKLLIHGKLRHRLGKDHVSTRFNTGTGSINRRI